MKLCYLVVNQAWVILFGEQLIDIDGRRLFETRAAAVYALEHQGLGVTRSGNIFALPK